MFQGDQDMADQNEAKTKTIGFLPIEKVQTLKGWDEYVEKSTKLSVLRTEAQRAKNSVRDALKERLNEDGDMQQQGRRTRSLDLSSSFREQPLKGKTETNSECDNAGVSDETEGAATNLNPVPEEAAAILDPVTERLVTLMREKGQR